MLSGAIVDCEDAWSTNRPAVKNQVWSFRIGPPNVYSYCGTLASILDGPPFGPHVSQSISAPVATLPVRNGWASLPVTYARHLSLYSVSRKLPLKMLPPDLAIMVTTPPLNPP